MIDEKKSKERFERQKAREAKLSEKDMANIWQPLKDAVLAQGASELRDYHGQGFVHAPFGWRSPNPAELGVVLEKALSKQLSQLVGERFDEPEGNSAESWERRSELSGEKIRVMSLAAWGVGFVGECWGYGQALEAVGRACRELPVAASPAPLHHALLRGALDCGWRSTPSDVAERLNAFARNADIWSKDTAWGARVASEKEALYDALLDRFDVGHWGGALVKAATERHDCAESAAFLIKKFAAGRPGVEVDWSESGSKVGKQMGYLFVRADKLPEAFFEHLPMEFWLGAKTEMGPASKVGAAILQRLLARAKTDAAMKERLCAVVWMGLDRKEIDAFDANFPGEAAGLLKPGVRGEFSDMIRRVSASYRLETSLGRPSGAWARKAFASQGLDPETVADKVYRHADAENLLVASLESAYATREALLIKASVKEAAVDKAAKSGKKLAVVKKGKPKRI